MLFRNVIERRGNFRALFSFSENGARRRIRTTDTRIFKPVLTAQKQSVTTAATVKPASEDQCLNGELSNSISDETTGKNENPGALAGATGAYNIREWFARIDHNTDRESRATRLALAIVDCDPADRLPFLCLLLDALRAGAPVPAFGAIMAEASDWAAHAAPVELDAYCAATFAHMAPDRQNAFRRYISTAEIAA